MIVAPSLFWGFYIFYKDRYKPEPIGRLALSYLLGIGSSYLALGFYGLLEIAAPDIDPLELMLHDRAGFFLYSISAIGSIEELSKLLPFLLVCSRFRQFDEKMDGIVYASMLGLGFASIENMRMAEVLEGFELYGHAIASPVVHMSFASLWGVAYSIARFRGNRTGPISALAFFLSSVLHGIYDFLATAAEAAFSSAGVILILWSLGILVMRKFQQQQIAENKAVHNHNTGDENS